VSVRKPSDQECTCTSTTKKCGLGLRSCWQMKIRPPNCYRSFRFPGLYRGCNGAEYLREANRWFSLLLPVFVIVLIFLEPRHIVT
jgi:hypothetical protein